jgi:FemAB-related protein (PEP-CTERM system-associated)
MNSAQVEDLFQPPVRDTSSPERFADAPAIASVPVEIKSLARAEIGRWDDFVSRCEEATFFHRAGWQQIIERAFGHDTYFLYAEAGGEIQGVLPLGHIRSRLFGNALISSPFCVYGGVAATTQAARDALEAAAFRIARESGADYLELRNREGHHPDWPTKDLYVTFRKAIDPDPQQNLLAIPRKQRAMVRKGIEAGLKGELDDDVDRFYLAYADSVHRLGTPVFSKHYFRLLKEVFGQDCEVLTVTKHGRAVASVLSFYFRDEVLPYYGGGTQEARDLKGNDFMYWELMRRACERGFKVFDYGRSKRDSGSYSFKKNWGFEPKPLYYEYQLFKLKELPEVSPLNPKYRLFIEAWKRMPSPLTRLIGPYIARNLG